MLLQLRKCKKLPQIYRKLADWRLRNTSCSFAEFAVAELSVNLRYTGLLVGSLETNSLNLIKCNLVEIGFFSWLV